MPDARPLPRSPFLRKWRALAALALAGAVAFRPLLAGGFGLDPARDSFHLDGVRFTDDPPPSPVEAAKTADAPPAPAKPRRLLDTKTLLFIGGVLVATPVLGYFSWWQNERTGRFSVAHERWFQEDTYVGGADKVSHVAISYMGAVALQNAYRRLGKTPSEARSLAFGTTVLAGLVIELGDGFTTFGFSWEDATANVVGAGIATALDRYGLKDVAGMRYGIVPGPIPPPCCRFGGSGRDYSKQLYTADVKLAGFLPRVGVRPGPARFLLLSGTYSSKGYRFSPPENRRREIGIEVGLNLPEILRAVGVRDDTWWGKPLLVLLTFFRVPYTAFGWRYDLTSRSWSGPNTGEKYDPGLIIYD